MSKTRKPMKYVIVTGGVVSGLGKGITISSVWGYIETLRFSCDKY